jgi:glycosyltransferase involved in cell wall biosynthesis
MLLNGQTNGAPVARRLILKACLWGWINTDVAGCYLFNTSHTGLENKGYAALLRRWGARPIFVVHDLIPVTHPEYCGLGTRERHKARIHNVVTMGCGIIANSHDTLDALKRFSNEAGLRLPPVVVAPLASGLTSPAPAPRPIKGTYFIVLGNIESRKNHWLLLQLWRRLVERLGDAAPRLVIIGQRGWECENVVDLLERCEQLRGFVFEQNHCSDEELVIYLHHAQALLYPSFVEGFGLPILEALSLGVPVIASDLPVFREIAGAVPEYADPLDGQRWMELIDDYADAHSVRRKAQLERMADFHPTTWVQHLNTVDEFLKQLSDRPPA